MIEEFMTKTIEELTIIEGAVVLLVGCLCGLFICWILLKALASCVPKSGAIRLPQPKPGTINPFMEGLLTPEAYQEYLREQRRKRAEYEAGELKKARLG